MSSPILDTPDWAGSVPSKFQLQVLTLIAPLPLAAPKIILAGVPDKSIYLVRWTYSVFDNISTPDEFLLGGTLGSTFHLATGGNGFAEDVPMEGLYSLPGEGITLTSAVGPGHVTIYANLKYYIA